MNSEKGGENKMAAAPKFHVGQIVILKSKKSLPFRVLEVIDGNGEWFYRWNRNNAAAEHMLREQTETEKGGVSAEAPQRLAPAPPSLADGRP